MPATGWTRRSSGVEGLVLKRGVDMALSGLLLMISLPLVAAAAIAIKLDSEGPAFFCQARMGRGFRVFQIWKLRTMRRGSDGPVYALAGDPRVTRVGRWLRRFKVDELPQLWNVARGEMSLVGPRPVVPELALEFRSAYERLLEVRPGLTDPATLQYCREAELLALSTDPLHHFKTVVTPDKLRISAAYLQGANLWSDLGLLAGTVPALFQDNFRPRWVQQRFARQDQTFQRLIVESAPGAEAQTSTEIV
jgi:lipopolysaccharide/colanic/teichoic acid biosynthesis glycosyltransferase